jgi:DNA polymerase-3 subunit beta
MKFIADVSVIRSALKLIEKSVAKRSAVPILSTVMIGVAQLDSKSVSMCGTDLDHEMTATIAADVKAEGAACVEAHLLSQIVGKLPNDAEVTFEHDHSKGVVAVRCGRSRFMLRTMPVEDFPQLSASEISHRFTLKREQFDLLFRVPRFAVSQEETRYYLNGIYLHVREDGRKNAFRLYACATDGHRMALTKSDLPDGAENMPGVIVPRATVDQVLRAVDTVKPEQIGVGVNRECIQFEIGDVLLTSKLIYGSFPDYARVIPLGNDKTARVEADRLREVAGRVTTISSKRGRAVKLSFEPNQIKLSVSNPDVGSSEEEVEAEYDNDPLDIGFNSVFLCDILGEVKTDTVKIKMADPGSPTLFTPADEDDMLFILMPMRV